MLDRFKHRGKESCIGARIPRDSYALLPRRRFYGFRSSLSVVVLPLLGSAAVLLSLPRLAFDAPPALLQQKSAPTRAKKPSSPIDPRSIQPAPGVTSKAPPPQRPHLFVTASPASARVGEVVTFSFQPLNLVSEYSRRLQFNFGDGTGNQTLEPDKLVMSHPYLAEGKYDFSVFLTDSIKVNDPLIVEVAPWALRAVPAEVQIGDEVSFAIDSPPHDRAFEYWFHFDDDDSPAEGWSSNSQTSHRYHSAKVHHPYAEVRCVANGLTKPVSTVSLNVMVSPLRSNALQLAAKPPGTVDAGSNVSFTATLVSGFDSSDPHIRYRFFFAENDHPEFQSSPEALHPYLQPGTQRAHVEAWWVDESTGAENLIATSAPPYAIMVTEATQVNPPSQNDPRTGAPGGGPDWTIITISIVSLIALGGLVAGYRTLKGQLSAKPEYRAFRDIGVAQTDGRSPAIEFDIRLKPDVTEARYKLDVPEGRLIRYERRQHG